MVRQNVYQLDGATAQAFVDALNAMKSSGVYDDFTRRHMTAMMELTLMPGETSTDTQRNAAHKGSSFCAWHRAFLREFEVALGVPVPYWRWEEEGAGWRSAPLWQLIGGNGDPNQGDRVTDGPFAWWSSLIWNVRRQEFVPRDGILRRFSATGNLPTPANVRRMLDTTPYDAATWNEFSQGGFRLDTEARHDAVHNRIGGDMKAGTAPNDPVFWMHHSNIDRLWAIWQTRHGMGNYAPTGEGPPGHNLHDTMGYLQDPLSPADVLDWTGLGYSYDALGA